MKNLKKVLAVLLAMVMVIGLAACSGGNNGGGEGSSETGSVYWLNFKPELDETAQQLAKMYTEKTGTPVKVVTAASGSYGQTLTLPPCSSSPTSPWSRNGATMRWI